MAFKRYVPFVLLNIVVSAGVVLGVLYLWEQKQEGQQEIATATSIAATAPAATAVAIATASAPPAPTEASSNKVRHTVQAGENLGSIAQRYDLSWEDIAIYNNLEDPNWLPAGTVLIIPVGGIPTPTSTPTPVPTSAEPPTPITPPLSVALWFQIH